jgi:hypothetical protein
MAARHSADDQRRPERLLPSPVPSRLVIQKVAVFVGRKRTWANLPPKAWIGHGQRRKILYWAACRVGEVIAAGEIGTELGVELLSQAATVAGLPEVVARWIIAGGLRRGK